MNYNSNKNQAIKSKLVEKHVYANVNTMVDELLKAYHLDSNLGFDLFEVMEPYVSFNGESYSEDEANALKEKYEEYIDRINELDFSLLGKVDPISVHQKIRLTDLQETIQSHIDELQDLEAEYPEVYEWYLVGSWFAERLKDKGEVIYEGYGSPIWGRQATGQAILLDFVISSIAEDMEILEGQKKEWLKS